MRKDKYTVNFYLEIRKKATGDIPINLKINYAGKSMYFYSGHRISPDKWIKELDGVKIQRVKKNAVNSDKISASKINKKLTRIETIIDEIFKKEDNPEKENVRATLRKELNEQKTSKSENDIFHYFDLYIENIENESTKRTVKSTKAHFKAYSIKKNITITFSNCDKKVMEGFEKYIKKKKTKIQKYKSEKELSENTIYGIFKRMRMFFNFAIKKKWIDKNPCSDIEIKKESYGEPIFLTKKERDFLYEVKIKNERLARVRDLFVLQCMLGCRVSDFIRLKKENIINDTIQYIPGKTKDKNKKMCEIPLTDKAKSIMNKYNAGDYIMPFISGQRYNDYLKELFKEVGLTRSVVRLNPVSKETEIVPLYKVASSHMARRTFIGLLHKNAKNETIADMSGHIENSRAFARYYKVDLEDKKKAMKYIE